MSLLATSRDWYAAIPPLTTTLGFADPAITVIPALPTAVVSMNAFAAGIVADHPDWVSAHDN